MTDLKLKSTGEFTKNPEKPLIRDLIIEGLSLARTQKEELLQLPKSNDNSIEALFDSLVKFVEEYLGGPPGSNLGPIHYSVLL